jgi:hypothetical protein
MTPTYSVPTAAVMDAAGPGATATAMLSVTEPALATICCVPERVPSVQDSGRAMPSAPVRGLAPATTPEKTGTVNTTSASTTRWPKRSRAITPGAGDTSSPTTPAVGLSPTGSMVWIPPATVCTTRRALCTPPTLATIACSPRPLPRVHVPADAAPSRVVTASATERAPPPDTTANCTVTRSSGRPFTSLTSTRGASSVATGAWASVTPMNVTCVSAGAITGESPQPTCASTTIERNGMTAYPVMPRRMARPVVCSALMPVRKRLPARSPAMAADVQPVTWWRSCGGQCRSTPSCCGGSPYSARVRHNLPRARRPGDRGSSRRTWAVRSAVGPRCACSTQRPNGTESVTRWVVTRYSGSQTGPVGPTTKSTPPGADSARSPARKPHPQPHWSAGHPFAVKRPV